MSTQSLYHTYKRYRTLQTDTITALPIVILMPHSACNCRCVMCDIWKGNKNLKQLTEPDITGLLSSLKKFGTKQVVMSGGEALLNPNFFRFCRILQQENIKVTLLSTGLTLKNNAEQLVTLVNDIIVSLDGNEVLHDTIRNIPGAYSKMKEGIAAIRAIDKDYKITGRTVIHKLNYQSWPDIIDSAKESGLDQISFLPADVSSEAFNREVKWDTPRQQEIMIPKDELPVLETVIEHLITTYKEDFDNDFIAESPEKIQKIYTYYSALHGINSFPYKKCNAPWVSTVIEADGSVRPCFFHPTIGNIRAGALSDILNSHEAKQFRKTLDMDTNSTCVKCVCYLNLSPNTSL
ncbi:MAG: Radical domain protein [Chitinophagaceae bacterium]|nr:Radical domain protein [Chitinophagaceae bacterium]